MMRNWEEKRFKRYSYIDKLTEEEIFQKFKDTEMHFENKCYNFLSLSSYEFTGIDIMDDEIYHLVYSFNKTEIERLLKEYGSIVTVMTLKSLHDIITKLNLLYTREYVCRTIL